MSVNGGNQTVPTLLFPDGSAATNPSIAQVRDRLGLTSRHAAARVTTVGGRPPARRSARRTSAR